ncbi:hypothetical protein VNO77_23398 [Canavalia gladiata]|uniref:Uncharacterized protein n=1 Tax=Canavalia gladiata TaxID=3824 RepID=A0AAN9L5R0_CANGL
MELPRQVFACFSRRRDFEISSSVCYCGLACIFVSLHTCHMPRYKGIFFVLYIVGVKRWRLQMGTCHLCISWLVDALGRVIYVEDSGDFGLLSLVCTNFFIGRITFSD